MTEPTCRACYAATLTDAERERFYAEPVTAPIHWCANHQKAMDDVLSALPQVQLLKANALGFEFGPTPAREKSEQEDVSVDTLVQRAVIAIAEADNWPDEEAIAEARSVAERIVRDYRQETPDA